MQHKKAILEVTDKLLHYTLMLPITWTLTGGIRYDPYHGVWLFNVTGPDEDFPSTEIGQQLPSAIGTYSREPNGEIHVQWNVKKIYE